MSKLVTQPLEELISSNKDIFYKELKEVIKPGFTGLDDPEKYKSVLESIISTSERKPFARQARLISAASEYLSKKKKKSLLISAEMGTGKTQMGVNLTQYLSFISQVTQSLNSVGRFKVNFILCPPHLVDKWADEILSVHNQSLHGKIKIIKVNRWNDLTPYTKRDMRKDGVKYYFIVSRETAKLGYPKQVAVNVKRRYITTEEEFDGQTTMLQKLIKVAKCPDCDALLAEGNEDFIDLSVKTTEVPYACECGCVLRQVDKTVSLKMQNRVSIVEYIKRNWTKGTIDLLIVDEIHEYKGGNTGQGNALAQFCSMSKKIVGLTGTLLNGYASSLFYILYRLNPNLMNKKLGYDYNQVKLFVDAYGAHEEVVEAKEISAEGVVTKMGRRIALKEKAKISPHLLSVLLGMTIFLRLDEIKMKDGAGLPDYDESIELVEMDEDIKKPYMSYLSEITLRIRKDKRFLGNLANDAIAVPDMPFQIHSAQDEIFYEPPFTREEYGYTAKEKKALSIVQDELKQGRKVLLYIHFSNKGVGDDMLEMLQKEIPGKVINFLRPSIPAKKRQAWIANNSCDVLICNPELVKTGLDLLEFPTIIFYETTYNVFTLKQASRRSWRIGQTENVKVIFMAYADTPQHKALELIGAKVGSANSLEGRLSGEDDLSSMGDDDDNIQLALAKAILNEDSASKDIQMNSIKNFGNDRDWDNFEDYYHELLLEHENSVIKGIVNRQEAIKTELIDAATKNELDGKSIHDGHGRNWGSGIAGLFGIASQSSNVQVCSMPKQETISDDNYGFAEGDTVLIYNEIAVFKKSPANGQLYTDLPSGQSVYLNSHTSSKFSLDLNKIETIKEEVAYVALVGKGKKQKKVEVKASNNLFDVIPESDIASGVQLAFAF